MDVLPKTFVQLILAAKWLVRHSSTSPKQQWRPLHSLLSISFFYVCRIPVPVYCMYSIKTLFTTSVVWRGIYIYNLRDSLHTKLKIKFYIPNSSNKLFLKTSISRSRGLKYVWRKKQNPNIEVQIKTRQSKIIGKIGVIHALWQFDFIQVFVLTRGSVFMWKIRFEFMNYLVFIKNIPYSSVGEPEPVKWDIFWMEPKPKLCFGSFFPANFMQLPSYSLLKIKYNSVLV